MGETPELEPTCPVGQNPIPPALTPRSQRQSHIIRSIGLKLTGYWSFPAVQARRRPRARSISRSQYIHESIFISKEKSSGE